VQYRRHHPPGSRRRLRRTATLLVYRVCRYAVHTPCAGYILHTPCIQVRVYSAHSWCTGYAGMKCIRLVQGIYCTLLVYRLGYIVHTPGVQAVQVCSVHSLYNARSWCTGYIMHTPDVHSLYNARSWCTGCIMHTPGVQGMVRRALSRRLHPPGSCRRPWPCTER
jgi:hypothetical protein